MEVKTARETQNYNDLEVFLGMVDSLEPNLKTPIEEAIKAMTSGQTSSDRDKKSRRRPRRANRMKVYDNGYIFTYDKDSQCGQRSFWRCERKTECPARVHTNPLTNQIIKRINSHTHEPSVLDELPPWLLVSEDASTSDQTGQTGVLLPQYSSSLGVAQSIFLEENSLEVQETSSSESCTIIKDEIEDGILFSSCNKKMRRDQSLDINEKAYLESEHPELFWNVFNMTKRIIRMIRNDRSDGCMTDDHFPILNDPILSASCSPNSSSQVLTVYFAPSDKEDNDDDHVYQMISLFDKTEQEFRSLAEKRGLFKSSEIDKFCINGPNGIRVELTDDMIRSWPHNAIFQFSISKRVCKIKQMID